MKITNTSQIPNNVARAIIRFAARELEITDYVDEVKLTNCEYAWRGRCWGRRVLLRVSLNGYPVKDHQYPGRSTFPKYDVNDELEALAHIAGHEFGHSRQFRACDAARVRREPGPKHSEREAEEQSLWVLRKFREQRAEILSGAEAVQERAAARVQVVSKEEQTEAKIAEVESRIAAWKTKVKRATTFLKKYERKLKRLRRTTEKAKS